MNVARAVLWCWLAASLPGCVLDSKQLQAERELALLETAMRAHMVTNRHCPTLAALHREGRISDTLSGEDPWGTPYRLDCPNGAVLVSSAGRDGVFNTQDDLVRGRP